MKKEVERREVKEREERRTGVYEVSKKEERIESREYGTNEPRITNLLKGRPFNIKIY